MKRFALVLFSRQDRKDLKIKPFDTWASHYGTHYILGPISLFVRDRKVK